MPLRPPGRLLIAAAVAVSLTSCVDGVDPTAVDLTRDVHLTAAPVFSVVTASAAEAGALTRARVTARDGAGGTPLASVQQDIDPGANEWALDLILELTSDQTLSVILEAELASVSAAGEEEVEWSGRTAGFEVVGTAESQMLREVSLYRGPLDNLTASEVVLSMGAASLLEGETAWLTAGVQGGGEGKRVYYESMDPSVATVDASGRVTAHAPGSARMCATVGPVSDTLAFTVVQVVLPDPEVIRDFALPQLDYAAEELVGTLGDPAGAEAIRESLRSLGAALSSGEGAASVGAFEDARTAWGAYGDPALRILDGPQLSWIELTLIHMADALGIDFG